MPLDARQKLRDDLSDAVDVNTEEEYTDIDEQISYKGIPEIKAKTTVGKLIKWVKRFITDKATNFLINASMDEIKQTIDILDVMDPTVYGWAYLNLKLCILVVELILRKMLFLGELR